MSLYWQNVTPNLKAFTSTPRKPTTNYGPVPNWVKTTGTVNGSTPVVGSLRAPTPYDFYQTLSNLPQSLVIDHGNY